MRATVPNAQGTEFTVQQRFEAKYLLTPVARALVRDYVAGYSRPDAHNAVYPVTSVYYDSPDWALFRSSLNGDKNRFKLRVRTYGDAPDAPCFAEIKQRIDRIVTKKRASLNCGLREAIQGDAIYSAGVLAEPELESEVEAHELFASLGRRLGATPRLGVRYRREAFQSAMDEPVRITFDSDLAYAPVAELSAPAADGASAWRTVHEMPALLEVKFTDSFPYWVRQMVDRFELDRISLAKYVSCGQAMAADGVLWDAQREAMPGWML